jgi:hypothetical protein
VHKTACISLARNGRSLLGGAEDQGIMADNAIRRTNAVTTNACCLTVRLCNPRPNCVDDELIRCIITVNDLRDYISRMKLLVI